MVIRKLSAVFSALSVSAGLLTAAAQAQTHEVYQTADGSKVRPLDLFRDCDLCPEMIVMPLGNFMMGGVEPSTESLAAIPKLGFPSKGQKPRHPVEMDIPYAMGRNEITFTEWMACVDANGCTHTPDHEVFTKLPSGHLGYVQLGPDHPVINVSYLDALEYSNWLNTQVGAPVYRLPTEAEWEYAARAGTETRFAQGDLLTADQANFSGVGTELAWDMSLPLLTNRRAPVPVHELDAANPWGLRHMSGNVI